MSGLITFFLYKGRKMDRSTAMVVPLLAGYLAFVFTITIFHRTPESSMQFKLLPFWSYRAALMGNTALLAENFWNIVLFIPVGILFYLLLPGRQGWIYIFAGALISLMIEIAQLFTYRGLFEFDDVIHNAVGVTVGYLLARAVCSWIRNHARLNR